MSGIATGVNKGYLTTKRPTYKSSYKWYLGLKKGAKTTTKAPGARVKVIREVVRETVGFAPYERRMMEILKGGGANPQKRAWRYAKTRLGTHTRAKKKVLEIEAVVSSGPKKTKKKAEKKE
mmetsp:Transcript_3087/g.7284  ORF Transcript_3087/g.7284 Transcript_3087/m.7284 type:complete len:121 (-) Transcript_3087:40-402(-)